MAYLVRKIGPSHWPDGKNSFFTSIDNLAADSISELSTKENSLSCWKIEDASEIESIALSFISKLNFKQGSISLVMLPFDEINNKFSLNHSPEDGDTAIPSVKELHYNISHLTYKSLGDLGSIIASASSNLVQKMVYRIRIKDAIEPLRKMSELGELDADLLGDYIKPLILDGETA